VHELQERAQQATCHICTAAKAQSSVVASAADGNSALLPTGLGPPQAHCPSSQLLQPSSCGLDHASLPCVLEQAASVHHRPRLPRHARITCVSVL